MKFEYRSSGVRSAGGRRCRKATAPTDAVAETRSSPIGVGEAHSLKTPFSLRERGFSGMGNDNNFD